MASCVNICAHSFANGGVKVKPYKRSERVSQEIKRILAETLTYEASDPYLRRITILRVEVTDDLRKARVFYSVLLDKEGVESHLEHAKGYLRSTLAHKMRIKFVPEIEFKKLEIL